MNGWNNQQTWAWWTEQMNNENSYLQIMEIKSKCANAHELESALWAMYDGDEPTGIDWREIAETLFE